MPKIIKKKPIFFVVPALIVIIGAVFLFTDNIWSASEFDREASPAGYTDSTLNDVVAHFNDDNNVYYVWAVGLIAVEPTPEENGVIFSYDGQNFLWSAHDVDPGDSLNGIDLYYDSDTGNYTLWAVGDNGYIIKYDRWDGYEGWGYQCKDNNCPNGIPPDPYNVSDNNFTTVNLVDVSFVNESEGWAIGSDGEIFDTTDGGLNWLPAGDFGQGANAIEMITDDNGWIVGEGGNYAQWNGTDWTPGQIGTIDLKDVAFAGPDNGWIAVRADTYHYYDSVSWQTRSTGLDITSNMNGVAAVYDINTNSHHVWFVGDDGRIMFSQDQDNTNWIFQQTEVTLNLKKGFAVNPTHMWSVGEESMILKISPGNTTGWGYVGADNCDRDCSGGACHIGLCPDLITPATKPVGWISYNCANQTVCDKTTYSYGVNIKKKVEAGECSGASNILCTSHDDCIGDCVNFGLCTNENQDKDVGILSGYGWFGKKDDYELPPDIACDYVNPIDGFTYCSNNHLVKCDDVSECACYNNHASCYSTGWLSFDRNDTGDPPALPYMTLPVNTPCLKDISSGDPEDYVLATFDYNTYAVEGWARFMTGRCLDGLDNPLGQACFINDDCSGGSCYHNGQGRCEDDWSTLCQTDIDCGGAVDSCQYPEGWIKFRGGNNEVNPDPLVSDYMPCNACITVDPGKSAGDLTDDDGDEYITCKICDGFLSGEKYMCNKCGTIRINSEDPLTCGTGRCSDTPSEVCIYGSSWNFCPGVETCEQAGFCIAGSHIYAPCTNDSHCDDIENSCHKDENWSGNTCNTCATCDQYGVSADISSGDWFGYAYSEDFGWIDMSMVSQYNTAWIRVQYGNIYSRGNVGSWRTAPAPGYTYSERDCNASYLILAGGRVINFCSDALAEINLGADPSVTTPEEGNPYVVEGYRAFNLPKDEFSPHSILGTIDYNYLVRNVEDSDIFEGGATDSNFGIEPIDLAGRIFHVKKTGEAEGQEGNLTINSANGFEIGNALIDGSGLVIVDGDLNIESNIIYDDTGVNKIKQVPSIGFYVKGNIIVHENVTEIFGTYYTEKSFITYSSGTVNTDIQLRVKGVLVAATFDLRRRFKGTINIPQPAEIITYDGRIQLNPPPGFRDLTSALPKIRPANP